MCNCHEQNDIERARERATERRRVGDAVREIVLSPEFVREFAQRLDADMAASFDYCNWLRPEAKSW